MAMRPTIRPNEQSNARWRADRPNVEKARTSCALGELPQAARHQPGGATEAGSRFDALVQLGEERMKRLRRRLAERAREYDPLALWLDALAGGYARAQTRRDLLFCELEFRSRILHDRLRLSPWSAWLPW